jgi:hypothetical protein
MRTSSLNATTVAVMQAQMAAFREKFGRDRQPDEPVFFDPESDVPTKIQPSMIRRQLEEACKRAGLDDDAAGRVLRELGVTF